MTKSNKIFSFSEAQTKKIAGEILKKYPGRVICLFGDLGSGKTIFVKGLGEKLKINNVKSPSYTLLREYSFEKNRKLYHYDFYRFAQAEEIFGLNFDEHLAEKNSIVVIEWADRIKKYLPAKRLEVYIRYAGEKKREIKIVPL